MQATARRLSVVSATSTPRRRLIRDVRPMSSAPTRFLDEPKGFWTFSAAVDVACPRCGSLGVLRRYPDDHYSYSFACSSCGAIDPCRAAVDADFSGFSNSDPPTWQGYKLFRVTRCRGKVLWVLNLEHCNFLRDYVRADLRERVMARPQMVGRLERVQRVRNGYHVVSRLPRWIVLKTSRPHVLRGLARLEKM